MAANPVHDHITATLEEKLKALEDALGADVISVYGPITYGVDTRVVQALKSTKERRNKIAVILHTPGGIAEVTERIANALRHFYPNHVSFIVPDRAMSAGTILVMSGDEILMNFYSVLGPIDPQLQKDGRLFPASSYLSQFEKLNAKAAQGALTTAEFSLLNKLDLGDLETITQARQLSIDLLVNWLSTYKFKDWTYSESTKTNVTAEMRRARATEIANILIDYERWHSHSRGIDMKTLKSEPLKLKVGDYGENPKIHELIHGYFDLFSDYLVQKQVESFVHSLYYI